VAPAEKKAMSTPLNASAVSSSTLCGLPLNSRVLPTERFEASSFRLGDGEVAALENAQDFDADGAGCADHGDVLRPHDPWLSIGKNAGRHFIRPMMGHNLDGPNACATTPKGANVLRRHV
jgi:hypothetical protein